MIIIQLLGGLGNQMFQYALGRQLAVLNNSELKFDITGFTRDPLRKYSLNCFSLPENIASDSEIIQIKYGHRSQVLARVCDFLNRGLRRIIGRKPIKASSYLIEKQIFCFDSKILKQRSQLYLEGYWQAHGYFSGIRKILQKEFSLRSDPARENMQLLEQIKSCNAVSLHVRRGDYYSDPGTSRLYACCNSDYYKTAIDQIKSMLGNPTFFVFSDEPDWAESGLDLDNKVIVRANGPERAHEDLRLMQNCRHHIIANSSFSWWGAWLNENPDKIVIAPKTWINLANTDTRDLIPESWIRL